MKADIATHGETYEQPGVGFGEQGPLQNSTGTEGTRTTTRTGTASPLVERVTALRGQGIAAPEEPKSRHRRQTQTDICQKDAEIPYMKLEAAARDLVCSLMERQDRMNEEIFYKLNDLVYRVENLEQCRQEDGSGK
jgi:hypothetical protein